MRDFPASAFCDVRSQSLLLLLAVLLLLLILLLLLMLGAKEREPFPLTLVAATPALVSRTEVGESKMVRRGGVAAARKRGRRAEK